MNYNIFQALKPNIQKRTHASDTRQIVEVKKKKEMPDVLGSDMKNSDCYTHSQYCTNNVFMTSISKHLI